MKKLLVVVDFQNDFVDGSLGFEGAKDLEKHICDLIRLYQNEQNDIIYTLDTHQNNYLETYEGQYLPVPHCIENTEGWQLYGEVKNLLKDSLYFKKETFPSLDFANYLKDKNYNHITFVGLVSHICVISNAIMAKAALPSAHIVIDLKGTSSAFKDTHNDSISVMKSLQFEIKE